MFFNLDFKLNQVIAKLCTTECVTESVSPITNIITTKISIEIPICTIFYYKKQKKPSIINCFPSIKHSVIYLVICCWLHTWHCQIFAKFQTETLHTNVLQPQHIFVSYFVERYGEKFNLGLDSTCDLSLMCTDRPIRSFSEAR